MDNQDHRNENNSSYSYSYIRDGGNENTTWRADDNTGHSYNQAGSSYQHYETPKQKKKWFHGGGFKQKMVRCVALALVFGLVAGGVFVGTGYAGMKALGIDNNSKAQTSDTKSVSTTKVTGTTTGTKNSTTTSSDISGIVDEVMPSIVAITNMTEVQYRDFFGRVQNYEGESAGSGIIISQDDQYLYIVTNNHVVSDATTLTVCFYDDQTVSAEVKGTDSSSDLAVVAVKLSDISSDTMKAIKVATVGDSDSIKVGDTAIAIGNALGYGQSVTTGVISALNRGVTLEDETSGETVTNGLIQTDAAINPGNSGGALLNANGEVIGINSAKIATETVEGIGYAIPVSDVSDLITNLMNQKTKTKVAESERGYIGIKGVDVTSDSAQMYNMPTGVYVSEVISGGGAEKAGITKGAVITGIEGTTVDGMDALQEQLQYYAKGDKVSLTIQIPQSNGEYEEKTVEVTLGAK